MNLFKLKDTNRFFLTLLVEKSIAISFFLILISNFTNNSYNYISYTFLFSMAYFFSPLLGKYINSDNVGKVGNFLAITGFGMLSFSNFNHTKFALILVIIGLSLNNVLIAREFTNRKIKEENYWINQIIITSSLAILTGILIYIVGSRLLNNNLRFLPFIFLGFSLIFLGNNTSKHTELIPHDYISNSSSTIFFIAFWGILIFHFLQLLNYQNTIILTIFPILFLMMMPIVSGLFNYLRKGKLEPDNSTKFYIGAFITGLGTLMIYYQLLTFSGILFVLSSIILVPIFFDHMKNFYNPYLWLNVIVGSAMLLALFFTVIAYKIQNQRYLMIIEIFTITTLTLALKRKSS